MKINTIIQRNLVKFFSAAMILNLPTTLKMVFISWGISDVLYIPLSLEGTFMGDVLTGILSGSGTLFSTISSIGSFLGLIIFIGIFYELAKAINPDFFVAFLTGSPVKDKEKNNLVNIEKEQESVKISQENINFDFNNAELNSLVNEILKKLDYLKNHEFVSRDMDSLLLVEKIGQEYLQKIHKNHINIPENKRDNKSTEYNPYELTFNQLNLLLKGLDEIENRIVKDGVINQRATEIFLKEKVGNM